MSEAEKKDESVVPSTQIVERIKQGFANCNSCNQEVPLSQLFLCDDKECRFLIDPSNIFNFFVSSRCGSCSTPHFIEHAKSVKKTMPVAVDCVAYHMAQVFSAEVDEMFKDTKWGDAAECAKPLEAEVKKVLYEEAIFKFLSNASSIEKFTNNVNWVRKAVDELRTEVDTLLAKLYSHQENVNTLLEPVFRYFNIYEMTSSKNNIPLALFDQVHKIPIWMSKAKRYVLKQTAKTILAFNQ